MADGDTIFLGTALEGNQFADDTLAQYEGYEEPEDEYSELDSLDDEEFVEEELEDEYEEDSEDYDDDYDKEDDDEYEEEEESEDDYEEIESLFINGQEYSISEIMEWQKGNMRQADYTRKTQELARQREELKELEQLRDYLRGNPGLQQSIQNGYPVNDPNLQSMVGSRQNDMTRDLFYEVKSMQIDRELERLQNKYGPIDEVELFTKATELNTDDLESVYKMLAFDNRQQEEVDYNAIYAQAYEQALAELQRDKSRVKTVVNTKQRKASTQRVTLSEQEKRIANLMGLSPSEYARWRK